MVAKHCLPMANSLILALAMMLVIEGVLPFVAPKAWRETFRRITELNDGQIRFIGLASMLIGLAMLSLSR